MARRLYRSDRDRILGGVAGGIAEYFDVDPTLVRLVWVLLGLAGGSGILAYIIAWIIIPEEPSARYRDRRDGRGSEARRGDNGPGPGEGAGNGAGGGSVTGGVAGGGAAGEPAAGAPGVNGRRAPGAWLFGLVLVVLGFILLLRNFAPWLSWLWTIPLWPLLLIFVGAILLASALRRSSGER